MSWASWGLSWLRSWADSWGPQEVPVETPAVTGPGSGHPAGIWWGETKIKRGKRLDDLLKKAMEGLIELEDVPAESPAARAVEIIRPFVAPETDRIDWRAVEADLARVRELLALWQEQADSLEDEEILLMLMA
jgi:hypothetical protein